MHFYMKSWGTDLEEKGGERPQSSFVLSPWVVFGLTARQGHSKVHPEGPDFHLKSFRSDCWVQGFTRAAQLHWRLATTFKDVHIQGYN